MFSKTAPNIYRQLS